jgi:hypothetical protein
MNKSISKTSVICAVGTGLIIAVCTVLFFVKPAVENINSIGACQSYPTLSYGDMVRITYKSNDFYRKCQNSGVITDQHWYYHSDCDRSIKHYTVRVRCKDHYGLAGTVTVEIVIPHIQLSLDTTVQE